MAVDETIKCVNSIRNLIDESDYKIVLVDNNSPDDSYDRACKLYSTDEDIVLLKNDENLGFAKGNNTGFIYAKSNLNPEFIIMLNNDTLLLQRNLYKTLLRKYEEHNFAVMGPLIITNDGKTCSNPVNFESGYRSREDILKLIKVNKVKLQLSRLSLMGIYEKLRSIKKKEAIPASEYMKDHTDIRLHGSFMIFSRTYMEKFDGLDPRTFMYCEELFLQLHLSKNSLISLFSPEVVVFHKEDASTDSTFGKSKKKRIFVFENNIKSEYIYLDILEKYENS